MVDINFDKRERKHQRLWWNKVIGLLVFGPVGVVLAGCLIVVCSVLGAGWPSFVSGDNTAPLSDVGGVGGMAFSLWPA